jgi:hypothetical protein
MLKKILSIMMCLSFILSISAFTTFSVSAAAHPNFEVVNDFETSTSSIAQIGDIAIDGTTSLVFSGAVDFALPDLAAPTIANPTGVFFRVEVTKPFPGGGMMVNWTLLSTFVGYDGKNPVDAGSAKNSWNTSTTGLFTADRMQGIYFVPWQASFGDITAGAKGLNITNLSDCGWGATDAKCIIDDYGYYSVPDPANPDYTTVAPLISSNYPSNPEKIASLSTGNYNNSVLVNSAPLQMQAVVYHASSAYDWTVDDANVATIDANGMLTPKKKGTVNVTITNHINPSLTITTAVHVVFGYVTMTCGDNGNSSDALYGIKLRLRGAPTFAMTDTNFVWSVASGPAKIGDTAFDPKGLDSDIANVPDVACTMVTFTGSGKVVIRAAFVTDPSVYSEYTFNVSPNISYLAQSILAAQGYTSDGYTAASWKALQTALASSVALYNTGTEAATQDALTASKTALDAAVTNLAAADAATSTSNKSGKSTSTNTNGTNPDTGASNDVFPSLIVAMAALGGIIVTVKKTILNK